MSKTVTGVRWQYRSLITLLSLWSGLVGFGTEYCNSNTCISCVKSLKPRSCLQPQVSSTALLWEFMSTIIPVVSSCPGACGYKPSNVLSGLKHWIILEYVGRPLVDDVDWTKKKSDDASEKPGAVWLVWGVVDHAFPRR